MKSETAAGQSVCCLCIDLIASTLNGLGMSTTQFDWFNNSLPEQFKPHIDSLGLPSPGLLVKFTGDGWLLMTSDSNSIVSLCCLAIVMRDRFKLDMEHITEGQLTIPDVRISICIGRDVRVIIPGGTTDWVGDSARLAVRASGHCLVNEILVNDSVRMHAARDFEFIEARLEDPTRPTPKADEQHQKLFTLRQIRPVALIGTRVPACFSYVNAILGNVAAIPSIQDADSPPDTQTRLREWGKLMSRLPDYPSMLRMLDRIKNDGLSPNVFHFNMLIARAPDYESAISWWEELDRTEVRPDVVTFSTLIQRSPSHTIAAEWRKSMDKAGVKANIVTLNNLLSKAPAGTVDALLEEMRRERISPNGTTAYILISKAAEISLATRWIDFLLEMGLEPKNRIWHKVIADTPTMKEARHILDLGMGRGLLPSVSLFNAVFSKPPGGISAEEILMWYLGKPKHPVDAIQSLIGSYRDHDPNQALRIVLDYPHLPAAKKFIADYPNESLSYFIKLFKLNPKHPNAAYASGIALTILGKADDARPYLEAAKGLSRAMPRIIHINKMLSGRGNGRG